VQELELEGLGGGAEFEPGRRNLKTCRLRTCRGRNRARVRSGTAASAITTDLSGGALAILETLVNTGPKRAVIATRTIRIQCTGPVCVCRGCRASADAFRAHLAGCTIIDICAGRRAGASI